MSSRRQDFMLGLVVIGLLSLFVASVVFIYPSLGARTRAITIHYRADLGVAPLKQGSAVILGGALQVGKVGQVDSKLVTVEGVERLMITVEAWVDSSLKLYEGYRISSSQPPVGGAGVVDIITVGAPDRNEVGAGPDEILRGEPAQGLNAAIAQLSESLFGEAGLMPRLNALIDPQGENSLVARLLVSLNDVNEMTASLKTQLSPDEQRTLMSKIHVIMDAVSRATNALGEQLDVGEQDTLMARLLGAAEKIEAALDDAAGILADNRPTLQRVIANVGDMTDALRDELLVTARNELNPADPASLLGKVHASLDRLRDSMVNVEAMTAAGRRVLSTNQPELDQTITNLRVTSDELRGAMEEIRAAPWRVFFPPAGDRRDAEIFNTAQSFSRAASALEDAARRLETILIASRQGDAPLDAAEIQSILNRVRESFGQFELAERYMWEQLR